MEGKWPLQFVCQAGGQHTAPLRNYARPRLSIEPFFALRHRVAVAFPPSITRNTLLILPSKRTPKGEPKDRFKYGFMDFHQDRIEAKCSAVREF